MLAVSAGWWKPKVGNFMFGKVVRPKKTEQLEFMPDHKGVPDWLNVWGTFFKEGDPMMPTEDIRLFVQDMKYEQYIAIFNNLEEGEVVEDKEFLAWLHPEFVSNYMAMGENGMYCIKQNFLDHSK